MKGDDVALNFEDFISTFVVDNTWQRWAQGCRWRWLQSNSNILRLKFINISLQIEQEHLLVHLMWQGIHLIHAVDVVGPLQIIFRLLINIEFNLSNPFFKLFFPLHEIIVLASKILGVKMISISLTVGHTLWLRNEEYKGFGITALQLVLNR